MRTERLHARVLQARFLQCHMTRAAAVHDILFRYPDLLDTALKAALDSGAIASTMSQLQKLPLVLPPSTEELFGRHNRQGDHEAQADPGKPSGRVAKKRAPHPAELVTEAHPLLQGQTQDQPGPRKKVPTAVSVIASIRNQVMSQKDSGFEPSQACKPLSLR